MNLGRPRKIEPEIVLDLVMEVFWKKGYEATSLADIMAATGLHKGSLYQTFGDKKTLFKLALQSYMEKIFLLQKNIIDEHDDPATGLKESMSAMLGYTYSNEDDINKGCMAVNALLETAPHDSQISDLMLKQHSKFESLIMDTLRKIEKHSGNRLNQPLEVVFGLLMALMCGLTTEMKSFMSLEQAEQLLSQQLRLLNLVDM